MPILFDMTTHSIQDCSSKHFKTKLLNCEHKMGYTCPGLDKCKFRHPPLGGVKTSNSPKLRPPDREQNESTNPPKKKLLEDQLQVISPYSTNLPSSIPNYPFPSIGQQQQG